MLPVFFGTTLLVFYILSIAPGGPFQQAILQLKMGEMNNTIQGESLSQKIAGGSLSKDVIDQLKKQYGLSEPFFIRYLIWLGLWQREIKSKQTTLNTPFREDLKYFLKNNYMYSLQRWIKVKKENDQFIVFESGVGTDFKILKDYDELPLAQYIIDWKKSKHWTVTHVNQNKLTLTKKKFSGILTGDLGKSYVYNEPVSKLIKKRLPISTYFGVIGFVLSYFISIPLGIYKAIKHGTCFDFISSILIFVGYSLPGYVIGALLLVYFGGGSFFDIFPLGGFTSDHFPSLSFLEKIKDILHHTFLPVLSYTIGSFATLTILMKNSFIENMSKDYVRYAFSKGLNEKRVLFVHVLRNSLIPIATGLGHVVGIFLAGSYFIERVFNIEGIGKLSYEAIMSADYPVVLGFLVINTVLLFIGNLLSDLLYASIDPRIRFH